jgi:hypothetical protein
MRAFLTVIVVGLVLAACEPGSVTISIGQPSPTSTWTATAIPSPTVMPSSTATPVPPTPTLAPTATASPTPTARPTSSPTPTLSPTPTVSPTPAISSTPLPPPQRMDNGFFLTAKPRGGYNYVMVSNPLPLDAVVVLVRNNAIFAAVYIQANHDFKIEALPLGPCDFYYFLGEDWNHRERQFTRKAEYHRANGQMTFTEEGIPGYIRYNYYTFSLAAGNSDSRFPTITANSFPALPK